MAKYVYGMQYGNSTRDWYSKEYKSLVECRKAAIKYLKNDNYRGYLNIYEVVGDRRYQIGELSGLAISGLKFYKSNPWGKPRPNNIKKGTWYLNNDGTLGRRV